MKTLHSGKRIVFLAVVLLIGLNLRVAAEPTGAGGLACNFVGRAYFDPTSGQIQAAGYFADITGITGPLFSGEPSEQSAFFTFRSDVFQLTPLPENGDLQLAQGAPGNYAVYLNPTPIGDWDNPTTFSSGQPIAAFRRSEFLNLQFAQTSQHIIREDLISAQAFSFNGRNYSFNKISPGGLTLFIFISNTPLPGIIGFPVVLPYAGSCIAVDANRGG
jgi:hypothetical protein